MWNLISFIGTTTFAIWVIFFDGAEQLEGTVFSGIIFGWMAPMESASVLKIAAVVLWLTSLVYFLMDAFS